MKTRSSSNLLKSYTVQYKVKKGKGKVKKGKVTNVGMLFALMKSRRCTVL